MSGGIEPLVFDDIFARMKDTVPEDARRLLSPTYEGDDLSLSSYQREKRRLEAEEKATLPGRRLKGKVEVESVTDSLTPEEKKNRADLAMLLKLNGSVTIDFASGDKVDPIDPIAAERRKFTWTLQDVSADGLQVDLKFEDPLYISQGETPDTLVANFFTLRTTDCT